MANPATQVGKRRLKILQLLHCPEGRTVAFLSGKLGLISKTVLTHLHFLNSLGYVVRSNSRRWHLASGFSLRGFNGATLD